MTPGQREEPAPRLSAELMTEGTDPLARAREVVAALLPTDPFDGLTIVNWRNIGDDKPAIAEWAYPALLAAPIVEALAAAGLLRDRPARAWTRTEYRVVWHDGGVTVAHGIDDARELVEGLPPGATGRIEQCDIAEYRSAGPWRPVEDPNAKSETEEQQ